MTNKSSLFAITILFSCVCASETGNKIERFSEYLIEIIRDSKVEEFRKIGCVNISCGEIGLELIFGENERSEKFKEIMSKKDLAVEIFGPYTVEPEYPDATYSIVFFSLSNSPFNAEGGISKEIGYAELYNSFLQTQVTIINGEIYFQRVPFYIESHHPYAGDYG